MVCNCQRNLFCYGRVKTLPCEAMTQPVSNRAAHPAFPRPCGRTALINAGGRDVLNAGPAPSHAIVSGDLPPGHLIAQKGCEMI